MKVNFFLCVWIRSNDLRTETMDVLPEKSILTAYCSETPVFTSV